MSLPPLDERSLAVLEKECRRLQEAYDACTEILGPQISPSGAWALERIQEAIEAIEKEIATRAGD